MCVVSCRSSRCCWRAVVVVGAIAVVVVETIVAVEAVVAVRAIVGGGASSVCDVRAVSISKS